MVSLLASLTNKKNSPLFHPLPFLFAIWNPLFYEVSRGRKTTTKENVLSPCFTFLRLSLLFSHIRIHISPLRYFGNSIKNSHVDVSAQLTSSVNWVSKYFAGLRTDHFNYFLHKIMELDHKLFLSWLTIIWDFAFPHGCSCNPFYLNITISVW